MSETWAEACAAVAHIDPAKVTQTKSGRTADTYRLHPDLAHLTDTQKVALATGGWSPFGYRILDDGLTVEIWTD